MTNEVEFTETGHAAIDVGHHGPWPERFQDDLRMIANIHAFRFGWDRDDAYVVMFAVHDAREAGERMVSSGWDSGWLVGGLA